MCAGPDALVSSNEAAAAAQQSAAPAVPSSPGPSAVPAVPDHDGGAGPRRKTALADAGDADARARAPCPRVDPSRVAEPPPRAPDRDRAAARAPPRVPAGRSVFPARGEAFAARAPGFANRRGSRTDPPPAFQTASDLSLRVDKSWLDVGASEKPAAVAEEKKRPRPFSTADPLDDALCERFGRDARLGSVDRETRVDDPKNPSTNSSTLRRSRGGSGGGSGSDDGETFDERVSADESPSRRRRLDRDGAFARRGLNTHTRKTPRKTPEDDAPMRDALSDFGPLMDLLEGRPAATAAGPSGLGSENSKNPSRCTTRRAAEEPPRAASLFADDPSDSVAAAGDGVFEVGGGGKVFLRQSEGTRVDEHERFDTNAGEETHGVGFLDGLLVDAVDGVFGPGEKSSAELFLRDCAHASVAPRITPPTPRRDTGLDPAAPAFAPRGIATSRYDGVPRTNKGRLIAPPAFTDAHFVPRERRAMWAGPAGTLPSAREVLRLVDAAAETQTRIGVPPFA